MNARFAVLVLSAWLAGCGPGSLETLGSDRTASSEAPVPPGAPSAGLYLVWSFDDDSTTIALDSSGNQRSGALAGSPTPSDPAPTSRSGNLRGSFFDGSGQAASYGETATVSAFTLGVWVKPACTERCRILGLSGGAGDPALSLALAGDGHLELSHELATDPGTAVCESCTRGSSLLTSERWYHLTLTIATNEDVRLYVDGDEDARALAPLPNAAFHVDLGSESLALAHGFRGVLDEVIAYDWALAPENVGALAARDE